MCSYASIFSSEMDGYVKLLSEEGRNVAKNRNLLKRFDRYLVERQWKEKVLTAQLISDWLNPQNIRDSTKAHSITMFKGFVKYLRSLDISADCPEPPKVHSDYVAYIFTDEEMARIFTLADNYEGSQRFTRRAFTFPILLRILYGCGLRAGEACSLQWKDVDLEQGVITIHNAKNQKQRFVPMNFSLTKILKDYSKMVQREKICADYLFESKFNPGMPIKVNAFHSWFSILLKKAGIEYTKSDPNERGPCPHCIRHAFVMKSFLKSENTGRRFEDTAPFLAAYLGHDGPKYTEAYLSSNHSLYTQSHQRVNTAIGNLFPEVCFDED